MNTPQIVVGIDGSRAAERAMLWAAEEAGRRGARLLIAHAGDVDSNAGTAAPTDYARALMVDAQAAVYDSRIECEVATFLDDEDPVRLLSRLSRQAQLVVVGSHGVSRLAEAFLGGAAYRVATHAHCPVALVPAAWEPAEAARPVVVGVSGTPAASSALDYAFAEAELRGVPLTAVRSWCRADWSPESPTVLYESSDRFETRQAERVQLILRPFLDAHPSVEVATVVTGEPIEDALLSAAREVDQLIVGCRSRSGRRRSRLGWTTSRLMHESPCPVIVIGSPGSTAAATTQLSAVGSAAPVSGRER